MAHHHRASNQKDKLKNPVHLYFSRKPVERQIMRNLDFKTMSQIDEKLYILDQTTAVLEFMQVAVAEGGSLVNHQTAADALFHVYCSQREALKEIHNLIDGE